MNQLGFVEPVDGFRQGVIVAIATAAHRGFDAGITCTSQRKLPIRGAGLAKPGTGRPSAP